VDAHHWFGPRKPLNRVENKKWNTMSEDREGRVTRLHLLPDNENETKNSSKRPTLPGRGKPGPSGPGGKRRPRIPPWVIALLFLGLVAYQLYAIFDPQRDTQSITVPY
jgi:hypothetical protein